MKIELSNNSKRFLKKCDKELYNRILKKIKDLQKDPFPSDIKRVKGRKNLVFRVRVGECRILYVVFKEKDIILIADIDKRPKAYD